jgi:hypothetical protein
VTDHLPTPADRDRAVRRLRAAGWSLGALAAALSVALSAVAAHAFKGHDGRTKPAVARVSVPPAQHVPAIAGAPAPLEPPAAPPVAVTPQPQPQPETSGGS